MYNPLNCYLPDDASIRAEICQRKGMLDSNKYFNGTLPSEPWKHNAMSVKMICACCSNTLLNLATLSLKPVIVLVHYTPFSC